MAERSGDELGSFCGMRLSEALARRADVARKLQKLNERMVESATYQEGTQPAESVEELLREANTLADELERLIAAINRTNLATKLPDGRSLTDAIAARDVLLTRIKLYRSVADAGVVKQKVYSRTEVKYLSQVDVRAMREETDRLSRRHRELDNAIQGANFLTDLLD